MTTHSVAEVKSMRRYRTPVAACILLMLTLPAALGRQALDVSGQVDRAVRLLLSPDSSGAQCTDGLVSLLDAIIGVAPASGLGGTWPAKIADARGLVAGGRFLAGDTVALLNDSYRAVHGKPFTMPSTVRSMPDAKDHIRRQLASVRSLLDQGRADEAVRRMLEAVLMIVTPLQA
jgi:hypothetical protein